MNRTRRATVTHLLDGTDGPIYPSASICTCKEQTYIPAKMQPKSLRADETSEQSSEYYFWEVAGLRQILLTIVAWRCVSMRNLL